MKKDNIFCSIGCATTYISRNHNNNIPSKEELGELIYKMPFSKIGKLFNVTDSAVRKWCKKYSIPYHYRDIHPKKISASQHRFLLQNYNIKITDSKNKALIMSKNDAISFIKTNYAKENTTERSIQTKITNAIKHNIKYLGFIWSVLPIENESEPQ